MKTGSCFAMSLRSVDGISSSSSHASCSATERGEARSRGSLREALPIAAVTAGAAAAATATAAAESLRRASYAIEGAAAIAVAEVQVMIAKVLAGCDTS